MELERKTTLTFDCYGTLIDWESGIWDGLQLLLQKNNSAINRQICLEAFAEIESTVQASNPIFYIQGYCGGPIDYLPKGLILPLVLK